jgi:hypothetical protein
MALDSFPAFHRIRRFNSEFTSVHVPPLMSETKFHTRTEQEAKLKSLCSNFYVFFLDSRLHSSLNHRLSWSLWIAAGNLIRSWSVTAEPTLMIPNNLLSVCSRCVALLKFSEDVFECLRLKTTALNTINLLFSAVQTLCVSCKVRPEF